MNPFRTRSARSALAVACCLATLGVARGASAQPAPDAPASAADADALFAEGNKAYDASDFALAAKKYGEAFALKPTHDIAANLGATELKLARFAEAANHLAFSIRHYPPSGDSKKKAVAERLFGEARTKIGALEITAPAGAEITVDAIARGVAPLADPVYVDPGEHSITAKSGNRTGTQKARVQASESARVDVAFSAASASEPPVTPPPGGPDGEGSEGPPLWPGIALAATGGVALGVGVGLFVAGSGAGSDADDLQKKINDSGERCASPPTGDCADLESKISSADGLHLGGGIAMGVGGALAAGGIVYLIWATTSDTAPESASIQPMISPTFVGTAFQGSF